MLTLTEMLINIGDSTLETYIFFSFLDNFLSRNKKTSRNFIFSILAYWTFQLLTYVFESKLLSSIIPTYALAFLIVLIFFEGEARYRIVTVHLLIFLNYCCRFFALGMYLLIYPERYTEPLPVLTPATQVVTCILFFLITGVFIFIRNLRKRGISHIYEFIASLVPFLMIVSIVIYIKMYVNTRIRPLYFYLNTSMLLGSTAFLCFFYLDKFNIINTVMEYSQTAKRLLEVEKKHIADYLEMQEKTRKFHHDTRNHLQNIFYLCNNGNPQEAAKYISQLIDSPIVKSNIIFTQNHVIDGLLQQNTAIMEKAGIEVSLSTMIPEKLPFDDIDICILLSNLLTNAKEACERIPNDISVTKKVQVTIHQKKEFLFVQVKNTFDGIVRQHEGHFLSIKRNAESVGIGLQNVQDIVQKYKGVLSIRPEDMLFTAEVLLPYPEQTKPAETSSEQSENTP